jgi:hypothetical protein
LPKKGAVGAGLGNEGFRPFFRDKYLFDINVKVEKMFWLYLVALCRGDGASSRGNTGI